MLGDPCRWRTRGPWEGDLGRPHGSGPHLPFLSTQGKGAKGKGSCVLRQVTLIKVLIYICSYLLWVGHTPPAEGVQERGTQPQDPTLPEGQLLSQEEELEGVTCGGSQDQAAWPGQLSA